MSQLKDTINPCERVILLLKTFNSQVADIKNYIRDERNKEKVLRTKIYGFEFKTVNMEGHVPCQILSYPKNYPERDYGYVDINIIKKDEIAATVLDENNKWLIFVDNINFGKKIKREIEACLKSKNGDDIKKKVVMITSKYEQDEESFSEVDMIANNSKFSADIIISTSVMDNGVSIKDIELRSIVLIADTETQFIQMLGRKRRDGQRLNLYIVHQKKEHFVRRKRDAIRILKIADKYMEPFNEHIKIPLRIAERDLPDTYNIFNNQEANIYIQQHIWIMNELEDHKIQWEDICNLFRVHRGILCLNLLAYRSMEIQCQYYYKIVEQFEQEGEDAFVKEQLKWLGKTDEEAKAFIKESKLNRQEKCYQIVSEKFEEIFRDEEKINEDGSVKKLIPEAADWKHEMKNELLEVVNSVIYEGNSKKENEKFETAKKAMIGTISRSTSHITAPNMKFLREYCGLLYDVTIKSDTWIISRSNKNSNQNENNEQSDQNKIDIPPA